MKKLLLLALVASFALLGSQAFAQTPIGTKIVVSWTPTTDSYAFTDVYSAPVACPASGLPAGAVKQISLAAPVATYDFTTGVVGQKYCFYVIARNDTGSVQSVASNTAGATFPKGTINPHTSVQAVIP